VGAAGKEEVIFGCFIRGALMRKMFSCLLIIIFVLTLFSPAQSIVKKKKKIIIRRRHYRRIVRNWPTGGPRPVFPKAGGSNEAVVLPAAEQAPPSAVKPVSSAPARNGFFAEAGLAGGGLALELGLMRGQLSGAAGYIFGVSNGVVLLDPIRLTCDLGTYMVGAGANCVFYSDKTQLGIEVFAARQFNKITGRIGYSSALGLRAGVGYAF
jgi:hypothetical protein